jgi:hypothetical protein
MILDDFSSNYEDIMYVAWLDKIQKQYIRDFLELRKKKREKITSWIVKIIVDKIKQWEKLPF